MEQQPASLGQWLGEKCQEEKLSLRQAAVRTGLSHATIFDIIKGGSPSAESIRKLAKAFSGDGYQHHLALEDKLLILSGYRSQRPREAMSEPLARLLDKLMRFGEPELRVMESFADFLSEKGGQ